MNISTHYVYWITYATFIILFDSLDFLIFCDQVSSLAMFYVFVEIKMEICLLQIYTCS